MALTDNLKDNNIKKIIIVELNYYLSGEKKLFMSDSFCLYKNTSEYVSLLTPEPRLESIPSFVKEIDLIKNEIIVKSSYTLKVNNKDNFYTQLLIDGYFDNQLCKIYITTENDLATATSNGEYKLLATAIIDNIKTDDDLSITLKELNIFEKDLAKTIDFYTKTDFTNLPKDLETEISPIIQGKLTEFKVENINYGDESTMYDTNLTGQLRINERNEHRLILPTVEETDRLAKMLNLDDLIFVQDNTTGFNGLPGALKYKGRNQNYNNWLDLGESEYNSQINTISGKKIYLQNDSIESNNAYFVTNTFDNSPYIFKNILSANFTTKEIVISDADGDFDSLDGIIEPENQDMVVWYRFGADNYTTYKEDVKAVSYNKSTKTLTFHKKEAFMEIAAIGTPGVTSFKIGFEKVRSVRINGKDYKNTKKEIEIKIGSANNFQANAASTANAVFNTIAKLSTNILTFTNNSTGISGNKNQIRFINDLAMVSPYTPTLSSYTNSIGGTTLDITYHYFRDYLNSDTEVGTDISQLITLLSGNATITLNNSGTTSNFIGELNSYSQYLRGGSQDGSYWIFNWGTDKSVLSATPAANPVLDYLNPDIALQTLIEFQVGTTPYSSSELTSLKASLPANRKLIVEVQTSWTQDQIGQAICDKINYWTLPLSGQGVANVPHLNGLAASYDSSTKLLRIKHLYNHNIDITFDAFISSWNNNTMTNSITPYFEQTIVNNNRIYFYKYLTSDNFVINIDKMGLAMSENNPDTIALYTKGNTVSHGVTNKMIAVNKGFQALQPGTIIVNGNPFGNFARYWNSSNSAIEIKMQADILRIYGEADTEVNDDNNYYVNYKVILYNNYVNLDGVSNSFYHIYKEFKIENVYVNYYNIAKTHISDLLEELMAAYGITNYSATDLETLKTDHPLFLTNILIKENELMYKKLNEQLLSFNLYSYVDNNGVLRFKFLDMYNKNDYKTIDYNTTSLFDLEIGAIEYDSIKFNLMYNFNTEKYIEAKYTDGTIDGIQLVTNRYLTKEIQKDTTIMFNFFGTEFEFNTKKYFDLFKVKYFKKPIYVNLVLDMSNIELEIGDNIKIENNPDFNSSYIYKICKIETDFNNIKIKALKLL